MYWAIATAAMMLNPTPQAEGLEIRELKLLHAPLGPARPGWDFHPLDRLIVNLSAGGLTADDKGMCDAELEYRLINPQGVAVGRGGHPVKQALAVGSDEAPCTFMLISPPGSPLGEYTLHVYLHDKLTGRSTEVRQPMDCTRGGLRLAGLLFTHDPEGKLPCGMVKTVGEVLHFRMGVLGYDRSEGKIQVITRVELLDADGTNVYPNPLVREMKVDDAQTTAKTKHLTFNGTMALSRAGEYRFRITTEDVLGDTKQVFETPFRVLAP